ncbi:uncharacterized protein LOC129285355 isoform X2 [Prosopis cineraria]|uniref:uncharacterized protein LOC129285355 isoform X2 n=2 Tax=Prosopis cineraria TaxID=364024 RepID=UPI00240FE697|nr:uncharacterized protein LOC129285355 isoform X2 [Prosopis cineraria]
MNPSCTRTVQSLNPSLLWSSLSSPSPSPSRLHHRLPLQSSLNSPSSTLHLGRLQLSIQDVFNSSSSSSSSPFLFDLCSQDWGSGLGSHCNNCWRGSTIDMWTPILHHQGQSPKPARTIKFKE